MKIGLISFAHGHAYSYASSLKRLGIEIVGIADEDAERGRQMANHFGAPLFQDYAKLLENDTEAAADAVIVCSENAMHADIVISAAQAGKHILCEKPLATTVVDAQRMIDAAARAQVKLMTAFPCRFHPAAIQMKQTVEQGLLGSILAVQGTNRGSMPGGWFVNRELSGGGALLDHTVHVVDLMRWIMPGAEVTEVYAEAGTRFHDIPVDDCGLLTFEFDNGVIASLDPSWSRTQSFPTWGDVTLEIVGTAGVSKTDLFKQNIIAHSDVTMKTSWVNWGSDMDEGLVAEFISCIQGDRQPSVTGEDGMRAVQVALAAYESAATKQPVRIS
ncbi:Gfo/Idh/MocA family protein [Paenibacillus solisilvae]|uniref:Gfo/Idh/MocA family protein n=1 Tax=Paenibacillus solisilvae TaxID=2486751 RepID=A0ABW0VZ05_9BACL